MALHCRAELWKLRNPWYGYLFLDQDQEKRDRLILRQKPSTSSTSTSDTAPFFSSRHNRRQSPPLPPLFNPEARHKATIVLIFLVQSGRGVAVGSNYAVKTGRQGGAGSGFTILGEVGNHPMRVRAVFVRSCEQGENANVFATCGLGWERPLFCFGISSLIFYLKAKVSDKTEPGP